MKDLFNRALSLGLGLAVQSKEQIEKAVDELVKKGEISRSESSEVVSDLVAKGQEAKRNIESMINERVQKLTGSQHYATKEQVEQLLRRIEHLEQKLSKEPEDSQPAAGQPAASPPEATQPEAGE